MKKTVLLGIVSLAFIALSSQIVLAATEVATPDIPSDYSDITKWPLTHTESCMPAGKEYRSTAFARVTNNKKIEYVLTTSLNKIIFRYQYAEGGGQPEFMIDFIRTEERWTKFNIFPGNETSEELFKKFLLKNGVSSKDYGAVCAKTMRTGFGKFWDEVFKQPHEE